MPQWLSENFPACSVTRVACSSVNLVYGVAVESYVVLSETATPRGRKLEFIIFNINLRICQPRHRLSGSCHRSIIDVLEQFL